MATQHRRFIRFARFGALAIAGVTAIALSGCSPDAGGGDTSLGFTQAEQEPGSPITVWVDATREPVIEAFRTAHPDIDVNVETYDGNASGSASLQTRIALFDQAGEGWPDVVFSTQNNDASWASRESNGQQAFAAPVNKGWFEDDFLEGFAPGSLDPLTIDGTTYGLRNDLAQVVFWYDQALFDQFGYDVPPRGRSTSSSATGSRRSTPATCWARSATASSARTSTTGALRRRSSSSTATTSRRTSTRPTLSA